ncbi:MAG: hypothetical protein ACRD8W_06435 [Nitrososphaeraceae archaeon]
MPNVKKVMTKKGKIREVSVREYNKEKIYEYIILHATHRRGIYPHEIATGILPKLTRQTIHNHLRELIKEMKISNVQGRYFPNDWFVKAMLNFASFMQEQGTRFIDPYEVMHGYKFYQKTAGAYDELSKRTSGITVSNKYCKTKFKDTDSPEKYLFEFVNRMGAFITYIFIESIRPRETRQIKNSSRHEMSQSLIHNSINISDLFDRFCLFLNEIGLIKPIEVSLEINKSYMNPVELDKKSFNKVYKSFRNIYPGVYEGLELFWNSSIRHYIAIESKMARSKECDHRWKEMYIYKYKQLFFCAKCDSITNQKIVGITKKYRTKSVPDETSKNKNIKVRLEDLDILSLQEIKDIQ